MFLVTKWNPVTGSPKELFEGAELLDAAAFVYELNPGFVANPDECFVMELGEPDGRQGMYMKRAYVDRVRGGFYAFIYEVNGPRSNKIR